MQLKSLCSGRRLHWKGISDSKRVFELMQELLTTACSSSITERLLFCYSPNVKDTLLVLMASSTCKHLFHAT